MDRMELRVLEVLNGLNGIYSTIVYLCKQIIAILDDHQVIDKQSFKLD